MKKWLEIICRLILGGAFLYAGVTKLPDPAVFQEDILAYQLIESFRVTAYLALYLPALELLSGAIILLAPLRIRGLEDRYDLHRFDLPAVTILTGLMFIFSLAYLSTLIRGISIGCGCFGEAMQEWPAWAIVLRDVILLGCGIIILCLRRRELPFFRRVN